MIMDEHTEGKRPLNQNEKTGTIVLLLVILLICLLVFYALITGRLDSTFSAVTPDPTPTQVPRIQQVGKEDIPFETPIEFYLDRGELKWREVVR